MTTINFPTVLCDSSRALMDYTASVVGNDPKLFAELMALAWQQKPPLCMRAARVADLCCQRHPELVRPWLVKMILELPALKDMAVKRVFLHILIRHSWVEDEVAMGKLVDTLFKWLHDDIQAVAVKAYAMEILLNITRVEPDLKIEMAAVLEEAIPCWDSAALRSCGRRFLKRLGK
jgi:hypothetical protein